MPSRAVARFRAALARWIAAGRPLRSPAEVARIFRDQCQPCPHFRPQWVRGTGRCGLCSCQLNLGRTLNKIAWATEACPDKPPRWLASVTIGGQAGDGRGGTEPLRVPGTTTTETDAMTNDGQPNTTEPGTMSRRERRRLRREQRRIRRAALAGVAAQPPGASNVIAEPTVAAIAEHVEAKRRRKRRAEREAPPLAQLPANSDPLELFAKDGGPIDHALRNLWSPCPAFLVCGGPSLRTLDLQRLTRRGICSLGVNNVAGYAPVRAFVASDPPEKFHQGIWFDPAIIKFVPRQKLVKRVRAKRPDGSFAWTSLRVADCPSVFGFARDSEWVPTQFLERKAATWGVGKSASQLTGRPKQFCTMLLGLRLLHYLGARRVYLLGVDFAMSPTTADGAGGGYAFAERRDADAAHGNNAKYRDVAALLAELRDPFERAQFQVFNCNRESRLACFPFVSFDDALADAESLVPDPPFDLLGWYDKDEDRDRAAEGD